MFRLAVLTGIALSVACSAQPFVDTAWSLTVNIAPNEPPAAVRDDARSGAAILRLGDVVSRGTIGSGVCLSGGCQEAFLLEGTIESDDTFLAALTVEEAIASDDLLELQFQDVGIREQSGEGELTDGLVFGQLSLAPTEEDSVSYNFKGEPLE